MSTDPTFVEQVILVDEQDRELGHMEKLAAHRTGLLHRAFSVFIFDDTDRLLLQRRADDKYHSGGLWSNTCCGHPRPGEELITAAERRLIEEMGMTCSLVPVFSFTYRSELDNGLVEHELDHVLVGRSDQAPMPAKEEASEHRWVDRAQLEKELREHSERFSSWFPLCTERAWKLRSQVLKRA